MTDELCQAQQMVFDFFMDSDTAKLWFEIPNPHFGNYSPKLIMMLREKKFVSFVMAAREDEY